VIVSDHPTDNGTADTFPNWGNHNGGTITFGADGMLYIALGDGGGGGDTFMNGQNAGTILGAISRINPMQNGGEPYSIPAGNLSEVVPSAAPELWDYGLRNPYRINFDGCTGDLYIGDVGDGAWEEVNVEAAGTGQNNYGWPITEGFDCFGGGSCDTNGLREPFAVFNTMGSSITGGTVYRGTEIPSIRGRYFYGEHTGGRFFSMTYDAMTDTTTDAVDLTSQAGTAGWGISSIQNSGDGEIYLTTMDTLYKLTAQ
jgi:glucose/arabinose dehydrogenase